MAFKYTLGSGIILGPQKRCRVQSPRDPGPFSLLWHLLLTVAHLSQPTRSHWDPLVTKPWILFGLSPGAPSRSVTPRTVLHPALSSSGSPLACGLDSPGFS